MATTEKATAPPESQTLHRSRLRRRWTRAQYDRMVEAGILTPEDRCELLEGEIVEKMAQSTPHATSISLVNGALSQAYSEAFHVRLQLPFSAGSDSEPEPDAAVVQGSPRDYLDDHPNTAVLVVEVSSASLADDRTRKQRIYARTGIGEYWIVNLAEESLEVYRTPSGDTYHEKTTLQHSDEVTPPEAEQAVAVADLLP